VIVGFTAGALGTVLAVLLSLPLRSPDDVFFNAATVALGGLVASMAAGVTWSLMARRTTAVRDFAIVLAAAFALVAAAALAGEAVFERTASYAIPLAAVIFGGIASLTPVLARRGLPAWAGAAALVPVVALAAVFAESGDEDSTPLTLPAAVGAVPASTAPSGAAPVQTAATTVGSTEFRTPADVQAVRFVVGEGSQSQFTVREQLSSLPLPNDATVRNTALTGNVHLDGRPTIVEIDLTRFSSDQARRDNFIRQMWSRQPVARVTIDDIGALPANYTAGEVVLLGSEAPITFDVEARLDGDTLSVLGTTKFRWADFNMRPPNTPTVSVEDEVTAQILLVAKAG
jgi:hypothetical protein